MFLSDKGIKDAIRRGRLEIEPFNEDSMTPNGYDLHVGEISKNMLYAGDFFHVMTAERIKVPDDYIGIIHIRSSYAKKGLLGSFGLVDAGFDGKLRLSFHYVSGQALQIPINERIAQISFATLESKPLKLYAERSGSNQHQTRL